jgi:hypothetical protein
MKVHVEVFWIVKSCSYVIGYQRFGSPCCLHLQGEEDGSSAMKVNASYLWFSLIMKFYTYVFIVFEFGDEKHM